MKKTFTILMSMAVAATASALTVPVQVKSLPGQNVSRLAEKTAIFEKTRALPQLKRATRAGGVSVDVKFTLDKSKLQYAYVLFATPSADRSGMSYDADQISDTDFNFVLPAGTYDFMAIIDDDEAATRIILVKEDVKVEQGMQAITFDQAEGTVSTRISHVDSSGEKLTLPSYTKPSNCDYADFIDLVTHNGALVWAGETYAMMECNYILTTNKPDSRFAMTRSDIIGARQEAVSYLIPVDYSKEVCGPVSAEGWQVTEQKHAQTPIMANYDEYYMEKLGHPDYFTFITRGIMIGDEWWGSTGMGVFDNPCDATRLAMWAPEDYDGLFDVTLSPCSNVFAGDDSSVTGLPMMRSENGLTQIGLNFGTGSKSTTFIATADSKSIARQNPRFAGAPVPGLRANSVPLFMACSDASGFFYTYKGRYGEDLSFDAFDILASMENVKLMNDMGGQPSDLKIYADDKLICADRHALRDIKWVKNAENRAVVTMGNVLIDGETKGVNTATVTWNAEKGNGFAPTFTSLQLRDMADGITDSFNTASEGVLEFTVADLTMEYSEKGGYFYFNLSPATSVTAEYAPHGTTDFAPLAVKEIPELYFEPGYGNFYRGSLGDIDRKALGGWFDLRLTATDADGAKVEQVLAPAFRIDDLAGISGVAADGAPLYTISGRSIITEGDTAVFTPDGRRCRAENLQPGVYIVSNGRSAEKVIIK